MGYHNSAGVLVHCVVGGTKELHGTFIRLALRHSKGTVSIGGNCPFVLINIVKLQFYQTAECTSPVHPLPGSVYSDVHIACV